MIRFVSGNIFDAQVDAIVNTVNLMGVMGKGIALQFKERFSNNFIIYQQACRNKTIDIGNSLVVREKWHGRDILVVNFPTKKHWRYPSQYVFIEKGLDNLVEIIRQYGIKSIAIPPLGAGNGGLEWSKVRQLIVDKLSDVDCIIYIFEPGHVAETIDKDVKLTPARALLLYMLCRLQQEGYDATAFTAVKSVYFLQKFGAADIFKLQFTPYIYGPYCDSVRHMLHKIDGAYIRGFADMTKKPFEPFDTMHEKMDEVHRFVEQDIMLSDIVYRTCEFLKDNWDDFSLELLSSVDLLMTENPLASADEIYTKLRAWSPRKNDLFADEQYTIMAYNHIVQAKSDLQIY